LEDVNARLWAWVEQCYHNNEHNGLNGNTPLARYQQDLLRIRTLGEYAERIDQLFLHRVNRKVRKDGTLSYCSRQFEVPYELSGKTIRLLVDPHRKEVVGIEDEEGKSLGAATPLDVIANSCRKRCKPDPAIDIQPGTGEGPNPVESAYRRHYGNDNN
jgi:putative transposase